jgi:hypothetical protein
MQQYKQTLLTLALGCFAFAMLTFSFMVDIIDHGEIQWPFKLLYWMLGE